MAATWISGSGFLIKLTQIYSGGLFYFFATICMGISLLILGIILVPRMGEFFGNKSIAESMGQLYGKEARVITAITGTISLVGFTAIQFKAFGTIFGYFSNISADLAIIIAGLIVISYSAFGGIKSVTLTDIVQFGAFGIAIPLIAILIWGNAYESDIAIISGFEYPKFDYKQILSFSNPELLSMISLMIHFAFPSLFPATYQRILMGRNIEQVKKVCIISAGLFIIVSLAIIWIPFLIFNIDQTIDSNNVLIYIIENYTYITGLKGLLIVGVVAMAMSTGDSYINSSSILVANDICVPIGIKKEQRLYISKIFSVILGGFSIWLALSADDLLSIILTTSSFYMPVVTAPLVLAILGFRSTKISVLIAMSAGFTTTILWKLYKVPTDGIMISMAINFIFLIGSHYLLKQKGGWNQSKDTRYLTEYRKIQRRKRQEFWQKIQSFRPIKIIKYIRDNAPDNELRYTGLGVYFIIYTIATMYLTMGETTKDKELMMTIYQIMLVSSILIMAYPVWPLSLRKEIKEPIIKTWWYLSIFYMLMLFNSFFVIINDFGRLQFAIFSINVLIGIILIGWRVSVVMVAAGFYLSMKLYQSYTLEPTLSFDSGSPQFVIVYILLIIASVVLLFIKPQQEHQEHLEVENEHLNLHTKGQKEELSKAYELKNEFLRNLQHEAHTPITGVTSLGEALYDCYDKLTDEQKKSYLKDIAQSSTRLNSYVNNMIDLSKLSSMSYELNKESVNFRELVRERAGICKKLYIDREGNNQRQFAFFIEDNIIVSLDKHYVSQAIDNIIINAIQYCKEGKITITVKSKKEAVGFSVCDEGIGVPKDELGTIFGSFTVSSLTRTPAGGRGVGLALCKKIIEIHGGEIFAKQNQRKGITLTFTLPK